MSIQKVKYSKFALLNEIVSITQMIPTPVRIQKKSENEMSILWSSQEETTLSFAEIRFHCRCAECVDEWTRVRKVKREQIINNIQPNLIEQVGRYAIQITWNDGHRTGIYPFDLLYDIAKGRADETHSTYEIKSELERGEQ